MPRGVPSTLEGWKVRLRRMAQYAHLDEATIERMAQERIAGIRSPRSKALGRLAPEDVLGGDPRLRGRFRAIVKDVLSDHDQPSRVIEHLAKQFAFACLLVERTMVQEFDGRTGRGGQALNNLSMVVARYAELLEQAKYRRPGRGRDETLAEALSAVERARQLRARAKDLEHDDRETVGSSV